MNWSKFKLKKICTVYKVTDSYHFNGNHNADSYLKTIVQMLTFYDLTNGVKLLRYTRHVKFFKATFFRVNPSGVDIECEIDFDTTTLSIKVIE